MRGCVILFCLKSHILYQFCPIWKFWEYSEKILRIFWEFSENIIIILTYPSLSIIIYHYLSLFIITYHYLSLQWLAVLLPCSLVLIVRFAQAFHCTKNMQTFIAIASSEYSQNILRIFSEYSQNIISEYSSYCYKCLHVFGAMKSLGKPHNQDKRTGKEHCQPL